MLVVENGRMAQTLSLDHCIKSQSTFNQSLVNF